MTTQNPVMSPQLHVARKAASAAAQILRRRFADLGNLEMRVKGDAEHYDGIVTSADLESEQVIVAAIRDQFPDHAFLAEEEHGLDQSALNSEHLWVIDPLDGTNNFAHGIEHYAISIAYYCQGQPDCGVIVRPESEQVFWAQRGEGAWFRDRQGTVKQSVVNQHRTFPETMLGVGFYYDRGAMMRRTLETVEALFQQQIHGIRRMGTAALDLVQVGMGCFGGFFEYQLSPWDFAAARLFVEESGGKLTTCEGQPLELCTSSVLATNGHLHDAMLDIVRRGG